MTVAKNPHDTHKTYIPQGAGMELTLLLGATTLCGFAWAVIAYEGYASPRGLPVGALYVADFSWLQGVAYLTILCGLVFGYIATGWWGPIVVFIGGNLVTRLTLHAAKESTQIIAPGASVLLVIACVTIWAGQ